MGINRCFLFLLAALCLPGLAPAETRAARSEARSVQPDVQAREEFAAQREFRGFVHRDMAERVARTAAELAALEQGLRLLAKEPDLQFLNSPETGGVASAPSLDGLVRMLFATPMTAAGVQGFPPHVSAVAHVRLAPPEDLRERMRAVLARPDLLELYGWTLGRQRLLTARYDALADVLLTLHPLDGGGREQAHVLQSIVNELAAMDIYISTLPLYEQFWDAPQKAREALLKARSLAPDNPLILTALAEAFLQNDRAPAAMEHAGQALRVSPEFARAHDVKGAILLRQRLPALAAESFGRAVALSPRNAAYLVHRASAYLVLENEAGLCADFQSACALGDCEGLQWARGAGKCR